MTEEWIRTHNITTVWSAKGPGQRGPGRRGHDERSLRGTVDLVPLEVNLCLDAARLCGETLDGSEFGPQSPEQRLCAEDERIHQILMDVLRCVFFAPNPRATRGLCTGNLLVYCTKGAHRAPLLCLLILIWLTAGQVSPNRILAYFQRRRWIVEPSEHTVIAGKRFIKRIRTAGLPLPFIVTEEGLVRFEQPADYPLNPVLGDPFRSRE